MHFKSIPTLEEINALGEDRLKADAIFVDLKNDIQLVLIKEFVIKLVTGLDSDKVIKKIAGLVRMGEHLFIISFSSELTLATMHVILLLYLIAACNKYLVLNKKTNSCNPIY